MALREIADEKLVPTAEVREDLVSSLQKQVDVDEPEEDIIAAADVAAKGSRRFLAFMRARRCSG